MALSSLSVVINAGRLRRWHPAPLPTGGQAGGEPQVEIPASRGPGGHTAGIAVTDRCAGCAWTPQPPPSSVTPVPELPVSPRRSAPPCSTPNPHVTPPLLRRRFLAAGDSPPGRGPRSSTTGAATTGIVPAAQEPRAGQRGALLGCSPVEPASALACTMR
jgi:hypothetical protein